MVSFNFIVNLEPAAFQFTGDENFDHRPRVRFAISPRLPEVAAPVLSGGEPGPPSPGRRQSCSVTALPYCHLVCPPVAAPREGPSDRSPLDHPPRPSSRRQNAQRQVVSTYMAGVLPDPWAWLRARLPLPARPSGPQTDSPPGVTFRRRRRRDGAFASVTLGGAGASHLADIGSVRLRASRAVFTGAPRA